MTEFCWKKAHVPGALCKFFPLACLLLLTGLNSLVAADQDAENASAIPVVIVPPNDMATGLDDGPKDGVFDSIPVGTYFAANSFSESRLAAEFDLAGLQTNLVSATLVISRSDGLPNGPRFLQVHGYSGDGTVALADFALDNLVGSGELGPGSSPIPVDVTAFVQNLLQYSATFAGFSLREFPVCSAELDCVNIQISGLSLEVTPSDLVFENGFEFYEEPLFPPTISPIANQTIDEDMSTGELGFTVADDKELDLLQITGTSSDTDLIPNGNIVISGTGSGRSVNVMPAPEAHGGPVTITLTVTDTDMLFAVETFDVTVNSVNDPPQLPSLGAFESLGNAGLPVMDGPDDLLAGVTDADGDSPVVQPDTFSSAQGGSVQTFADGTFIYLPPVGFTGADSFSYTVDDQSGEGNATAEGQVDINVGPVVWFVDAAVPSNGDGTLTSPFKDITPFLDVGRPDNPGEIIFFNIGSYPSGLELLDGQIVLGAGIPEESLEEALGIAPLPHSLPLPATDSTRPTIGGGIRGFGLAQDNTIRGVTVSNSSSFAFDGTNVGHLVINATNISTSAAGFSIEGGDLDISLDNLAIATGFYPAIRLLNVTGQVTFASGTVSGAAGGVIIEGGAEKVAINVSLTSVSSSGGGYGIRLVHTTGSFTLLGDGVGSQNGSGGVISGASYGVWLEDTTNITLNNLTVQNSGTNGIRGQQVTNFLLDKSKVLNTSTGNGILFDANLLGTASITNSQVTGSVSENIHIANNTGVLQPLTLQNLTIGTGVGATAGAGLTLATSGTANIVASLMDSSIWISDLDGISIEASGSSTITTEISNTTIVAGNSHSGIVVSGAGSAFVDLDVTGSTFSGGIFGIRMATAQSSNIGFDIGKAGFPINTFNNISPGSVGRAIDLGVYVGSTAGNGLTGRIVNNTISNVGYALNLTIEGNGKLQAFMDGNTATSGVNRESIRGYVAGNTGDAADVDLTITNNTFGPSSAANQKNTFDLETGASAMVCLNVRNNTVNRYNDPLVEAFSIYGTVPVQVESLGTECGGGVCANATALLEAANVVLPSTNSSVNGTLVAPASCSTVP